MATSRLAISDAYKYLNDVKEKLRDESDSYSTFLKVLKAFRTKRIGVNDVILRVKELFKEHQDLLLGFKVFLPKGYEKALEGDITPPLMDFDVLICLCFVRKLQEIFKDNIGAYESVVEITRMYGSGEKCAVEVYIEMSIIFQDHPDLLKEYCEVVHLSD
ncbi:unnamed protein product [Cochlearia groenlandica]